MDIQTFDFNLDLLPQDRWKNIFEKYDDSEKDEMKKFVKSILKNYENIVYLVNMATNYIDNKLYYRDEIRYIANTIGLTFGEILIIQLIYETSSACSVAMLNINNNMFYLRTMDWPMNFLKKLTINLNILKGGKKIGSAITWLGYVGFLTCCIGTEIDKYNIAINYRRTRDINMQSIIKNALRAINMCWPIGYLVRYMAENSMNYEEAIKSFSEANLISPCYINIFSHIHKSVIITRDADKLVSVRDNILIQTNCDYDKQEPNILWSCERRDKIKEIEIFLNKNNIIDYNNVMNSLMVFPILNNETIYYTTEYLSITRSKIV